ncbi:MAG TPA: hypothetical protein VFJ02_20085 [Vicinamibacterales bacterium]|nr:hypothetical protein [Vicinamibacterales bacterium]
MRRIEEQNPDIEFDWPRILKGGGSPPTEPRPPVEVRRSRQHDGRREQAAPRQPVAIVPQPIDVAPSVPQVAEADTGIDTQPIEHVWIESAPEVRDVVTETQPMVGDADTPAHGRLGAEGVSRLRARYGEIRARIADRISDPARRDELAASVERLNPDTWKTPDEVTAGLEQYEVVLASLREVVGRRRRKRRRGGRRDQPAATAGQPSSSPAAEDQEADDDIDDGDEADSGENDSGGSES